MFSSKAQLARRTGATGLPRFQYLQELVTEFQDTNDTEAKLQILANLANFAYDPINYDHFRHLHIVDLFLDCVDEEEKQMKRFALAGLCNCAIDPRVQHDIAEGDGFDLICDCLSSEDEETVANAITTLYYIKDGPFQHESRSNFLIDCLRRYANSGNDRLRSLATVYLEDVGEQV